MDAVFEGLIFLRSRIPAYADYGDEDARHLVDKQVRAYVGEALSGIRERHGPGLDAGVAERLEGALLLCEFTNQQLMHALDHARLTDGEVEHLHEVDHDLIIAADRAEAIAAETLNEFLGELEAIFARRARAAAWHEERR